MKIRDTTSKVRTSGITQTHDSSDGGTWLDGWVRTPHGIVLVMAEDGFSRLDFVWRGKQYIRCFDGHRYSSRGLVRKASQFVAEITGVKP